MPWDRFPLNPHVNVVTYLEHWELGPKECPFPPVRNAVAQTHAAVRALLKLHQTGAGTSPEPIPSEPPRIEPYSAALDQHFLRERWASPRRVYRDGRLARDARGEPKRYPWNPKWMPCSAWIHRARQEGEFPTPGDWQSVQKRVADGPVSLLPFSNGWVLLHFERQGWRWAGEEHHHPTNP